MNTPYTQTTSQKYGGMFLRLILPLAVLAGGIYVARTLMDSSPKAERVLQERSARLVEVMVAEVSDEEVAYRAMIGMPIFGAVGTATGITDPVVLSFFNNMSEMVKLSNYEDVVVGD